MKEKVFGIGLGKTGTTSLGCILKDLGYKHCGFERALLFNYIRKERDLIERCLSDFESFEDYPWPLMYRELAKRYPNAKFILTLRNDVDQWYDSLSNHLRVIGGNATYRITHSCWNPLFDEENCKKFYERHNNEAINFFGPQSKRLLIVNWVEESGWDRICKFLGKPIPEGRPIPRVNSREGLKSSNRL